ncbi:MAG: TIGR04282 family arsenosugar biosynthesis glycosyltransferase [Flavobacteriaceae bacterium]|nr:TIGR04282 family arsenosugar biosynthesis glycosyltransferase [Flavobacteriaceae bacterium]
MSKEVLLVFTRNPELGKVKSRLAKSVGEQTALDIYVFLLKHTKKIVAQTSAEKWIYFSENLEKDTIWLEPEFTKKLQQGNDLGARMRNAFEEAFLQASKVVVIGSDLYDLQPADIASAFAALDTADVVIGPAQDGGYYLLGTTQLLPELFENKSWGTHTVLADTLAQITHKKIVLLQEKNDVDYVEDIKDNPAFSTFLEN